PRFRSPGGCHAEEPVPHSSVLLTGLTSLTAKGLADRNRMDACPTLTPPSGPGFPRACVTTGARARRAYARVGVRPRRQRAWAGKPAAARSRPQTGDQLGVAWSISPQTIAARPARVPRRNSAGTQG